MGFPRAGALGSAGPISKSLFRLLIPWVLLTSAIAEQPQPTSVVLTKGTLSFDSTGVTFRTKDNERKFPFSKPNNFTKKPDSEIPGLKVQRFEFRSLAPKGGGPEKDVSTLTLTSADGEALELTFGQPLEVYRIEIVFADRSQLTLWQLASKAK